MHSRGRGSMLVLFMGVLAMGTRALGISGDLDGDGDVDLFDFDVFAECATGPEGGPVACRCAGADFDFDDDVDWHDFAGFQRIAMDPPADGICGNGVLEATEACDDGNAQSGDGCDAACCVEPPPSPLTRGVWTSSDLTLLEPGGVADMLLEDGVTDFLVKVSALRAEPTTSDRVRIQAWSKKLNAADTKQRDIRMWVVFNWFAFFEEQWLLPLADPYVGPDGMVNLRKPCPQSQHFWDTAITSRFVALAKMTNPSFPDVYMPEFAQAVVGVVLDPELQEQPVATYDDPCFCDSCFEAFFAHCGIEITKQNPLPAPDVRWEYLKNNSSALCPNLIDAYDAFEAGAVEVLAQSCREAFHAVNPDLLIAGTTLVRFDKSPFYVGMPRGFGTQEKPYVDFSQRWFRIGLASNFGPFVEDVRLAGIFAHVYPGLLMPFYPPDAFADHFYTMATRAGGTWFFRSDCYCASIPSCASGGCELCLPLEDYRAGLSSANTHLDIFEADPCHASPFRGDPFVQACTDDTPYEPPVLIPLEEGGTATEGLIVRREAGYFFHADAGEEISFDVKFLPLSSSDAGSGWWRMLAPDGETVSSGPLDADLSPVAISCVARVSGIHTLIVRPSFIQGFQICNASHAGSYRVVLGAGRLPIFDAFEWTPPQLYAYVAPGVTAGEIRLAASGSEQSLVLVYDERDTNLTNPLITACTNGAANYPFTLTSNENGVVLLFHIFDDEVCNPFSQAEDLSIELVDWDLPYLSQTRSGLFRQP